MNLASDRSFTAIELAGVRKAYGSAPAVRHLDLEIKSGEFFSLLGPSGCGKTTTLRMLAGFEFPDRGSIRLDGQDVTNVPANRREVNLVFQKYELFPHMSVRRNVGYGLRTRRLRRAEIDERVDEMLVAVGVAEYSDRRADQLSGGQQQRVALARALVNRPKALLLDEPLSALDVKLRKRMQLELKSIQERLGTTFVYVTHDQEEALIMSDRIGIMNDGRLLQVGTPREIYAHPTDAFVADFVGELNVFSLEGRRVAIRPERVEIMPDRVDVGRQGTVVEKVYLGHAIQYSIATDLGRFIVRGGPRDGELECGVDVSVSWQADALIDLGQG